MDIRLAAQAAGARFAFPFTRRGITPESEARSSAGKVPQLPYTEIRKWLTDSPSEHASRIAHEASAASIPTWDGAGAADYVSLNLAQRGANTLEPDFPDGAPDPRQQQFFLRFTAGAIALCLAFDNLKVGATKVQLIRPLTEGNPLGIHLCLRSLLEHRAVRDSS
jgi:hypothetical protein